MISKNGVDSRLQVDLLQIELGHIPFLTTWNTFSTV